MKAKYPNCDNCDKPIESSGKIIWREGKQLYVHNSYDMLSGKCSP